MCNGCQKQCEGSTTQDWLSPKETFKLVWNLFKTIKKFNHLAIVENRTDLYVAYYINGVEIFKREITSSGLRK